MGQGRGLVLVLVATRSSGDCVEQTGRTPTRTSTRPPHPLHPAPCPYRTLGRKHLNGYDSPIRSSTFIRAGPCWWFVTWKCLVACLFLEESQQPTCPHSRHRRRCTHVSPVFKQSSQPFALGVTLRISSRCVHCFAMKISFLLCLRVAACFLALDQ